MLSPQQITQYRDEGYAVLHGFLSRDAVDAILADIRDLTATATVAHHDSTRMEMEPKQPPEGRRVRRLYEPCTYYPRFRSLSESKELLDVIEQLIGPNLFFHLSKVNMKPAVMGSVVDWHQDLTYYPLTNTDSVTVLFYLDNADASNGCLQVIPRAHHRVMDHTSKQIFQGRATENGGCVPGGVFGGEGRKCDPDALPHAPRVRAQPLAPFTHDLDHGLSRR